MHALDDMTMSFQLDESNALVKSQLESPCQQRQLSDQNEDLVRLVKEQALELAATSERLRESERCQQGFLRMISHELRTSADGVLGVGNLAINQCQRSTDGALYADLFEHSSLRLVNFIEDASLLTENGRLSGNDEASIAFPCLLSKVRASLPGVRMDIKPSNPRRTFFPKGDPALLQKALVTMVLIATSFSSNKHAVQGTVHIGPRMLRVQLELDALSIPADQAADFFKIESSVRTASAAASLGLAPIVAWRILAAAGGKIRMVKGPGTTGTVEVALAGKPNPVSFIP